MGNKYNNYFNSGNNTSEHFTEEKETTKENTVTSSDIDVTNNIILDNDDLGKTEETQNNNLTAVTQSIKVNTKALNIRKEPNKNSDIVTIVYENELLILCESESIDGFYKVRTRTGFDGYCMEQFVDLV